MKLHANARSCPRSRRLLIERVEQHGWTVKEAAAAAGISVRTAYKWLARWRAEGEQGLVDRSSAPHHVANRPTPELEQAIRKLRRSGPQIAELLDVPLSTVSAILKRIGMGKLGRLGLEPAVRYERARPGELIHIEAKSSAGSSAGRESA